MFGVPECTKGTPRHLRIRKDMEDAGEVLSCIDPSVTEGKIKECFRLGKYNEEKSRPLLIKLLRCIDVESVLAGRSQLATRPGITIKPDLSKQERAIQNLLLKERRSLISSGVPSRSIRLRGSTILVHNKKHGEIRNNQFQSWEPRESQTSNDNHPHSISEASISETQGGTSSPL